MRGVVFALILGCLPFCFQAQTAQQSQPSPGFAFDKREAALGAQLAKQVRRETTPLALVEVDRYVDKLGSEIARYLPKNTEDWHFTLIADREEDSTYEPISLPGGWIFIPAQLVLASNNEGEFAGMLAHAMAHVALRQGVHRQTPGELTYLAAIPVVLIGPGTFGRGGQNSMLPVQYLNIQRKYELQADEAAVKAMTAADFDPTNLLSYVRRMQPANIKLSDGVSPLPSLPVRIANLERAIQNSVTSRARRPAESFHVIQDQVRRHETQAITFPPNQVHPIPSLIHPDRR